jgi:hypothetical protein
MTMKPVPDKAEVALDFPDKAYVGSFGRGARYESKADEAGVTLKLERRDDQKRTVELHLHYGLFADMLRDCAAVVAKSHPIDDVHRSDLAEACLKLAAALSSTPAGGDERVRYWVVGGEYTDRDFTVLAAGATEERHGPFDSYEAAFKEWKGRAMWTIDRHNVRFTILPEIMK